VRTLPTLFLAATFAAAAQPKPVTLQAAAAARSTLPPQVVWSPGGDSYATLENGALSLYDCGKQAARELLKLDTLDKLARSTPALSAPFNWQNRRVAAARPEWSADGTRILLTRAGDLFLIDAATGKATQLTATPETEEDAHLSPDGAHVAFRRGNDLYAISTSGGRLRRLTATGSETLLNGRLNWVYPEELSISRAWWWSPDSRSIAYLEFDVSPERIHPHADMSPIEAVAEPQRFPKAGTPNANVRLGVVAAAGGRTRWMELGPTADTLIARVDWMPGAREIAVQRLSRIQDHLELLAADARSGKVRRLLEERDPHWINIHDMLHFLDGGRFLWASERTGHRHLYLYNSAGEQQAQLTTGDWEVVQVNTVAAGKVYFTATKESPLERHLYAVPLTGGGIEKLTAAPGTHTVSMSPSAAYFLDTFSSLTEPHATKLYAADGKRLADLRTAEKPEYALQPVEPVTFRGADGTQFYGQLTRPPGFQVSKKYPAIVMVYGGPHTQTVRNSWSGVSLEQALAARGYIIWRMDNRGSNYRGHAFEAPLHRQMGRQELADQLEGVRYLIGLGFVDPARIGIHGWSYGGYMTLYALAHAPKTFAAGIAGAPVTDWRHYDTIYTERYMDLPSRNEQGYKESSPVHSAASIEEPLLLLHNFQDDNVLFQNTQHMMAALQRAGKQFEMMFYPLKSHGVTGPLRLHMYQTMAAFFDRHLNNRGPS
jgi:dipeptidyl-peptidase 4